ncbi:MAG: DNA mismatch repair endonuclease MutL [Planctomycetes bacterium]|nr:DNA mismatch repair endonuclease MutL [Planctomycetota bacterium]
MGRITRLDRNMINMIAAGEVIERPASVVKELMENSIDSGATRICVRVEDGGRKRITVHDNGCGMDAEDLEKAFETHATSKIHDSDDLQHIATLGFRGEALASVSSVAQVRAVTRARESDAAYCLEIDCGEFRPVVPCSGDYGTSIEIRDLFYKLPARRKFLRTAPTELGHITEQFTRLALANRDLHMELHHNTRELYRLDPEESLQTRIAKLFPALVDQGETGLIEADASEKGLTVHALLGSPELSRSNNKFQYAFLNGRFIRDRLITHAIKEAYRGLLDPNRHPVAFVFINMPFEAYDVNVHPTKVEVRFFQSSLVHSQVQGVLRETLLAQDLNVQARLPETTARPVYDMPGGAGSGSDRREHVAEAMSTFFKTHRPSADVPRSRSFSQAGTGASSQGFQALDESMLGSSQADLERAGIVVDRLAQEPARAHPFLQVHDSYLLAQTDEGFVVIDQHALHEKILYERLVTRTGQAPLESQRLLIPEPMELTESQSAVLEQHAEVFEKLGIEVVPFGPRTFAVQSFPTLLGKTSVPQFVTDLIDTLTEHQDSEPKQLLDAVLSMAACKAAIKAGHRLTDSEIAELLADGDTAESSFRCPHGRPTTIRFTLTELEKQFHRT